MKCWPPGRKNFRSATVGISGRLPMLKMLRKRKVGKGTFRKGSYEPRGGFIYEPPFGFITGFLVNRVGAHSGGPCGGNLGGLAHPPWGKA